MFNNYIRHDVTTLAKLVEFAEKNNIDMNKTILAQVVSGDGKGVWNWHKEWKMPNTFLSAPRLAAVAEIIRKWN